MGRRHQDSRAKQEVIAIVDIGSTAVRFLLARVIPGASYRVLVEERVPTRLGGGAPGTLPREAIEETLKAVHRFFSKYSPTAWGPRVVAVATSAVRGARNPEQLLGPLRRKEGIDVQVLSARDEAKLGVDAALDSLPFKDGVVADLGGASLHLSAVKTTSTFLRANRPRSRELQAFRQEVRERLTGALPAAGRGEVMVGMGGTVRSLASIHMRAHRGERKHRHGLTLQQSDVTAIRERLEALSLRKRRKIRGLNAERADIILAGAIVLEETMVFGGYLRLIVCTRGVRDGLLLRETFNGRG